MSDEAWRLGDYIGARQEGFAHIQFVQAGETLFPISGATEIECRSRARLIAAAPEMYYALERLQTQLLSEKVGSDYLGPETIQYARQIVCEALAKARGETP